MVLSCSTKAILPNLVCISMISVLPIICKHLCVLHRQIRYDLFFRWDSSFSTNLLWNCYWILVFNSTANKEIFMLSVPSFSLKFSLSRKKCQQLFHAIPSRIYLYKCFIFNEHFSLEDSPVHEKKRWTKRNEKMQSHSKHF